MRVSCMFDAPSRSAKNSLLNRCTLNRVPGVRIPLSPPNFVFPSIKWALRRDIPVQFALKTCADRAVTFPKSAVSLRVSFRGSLLASKNGGRRLSESKPTSANQSEAGPPHEESKHESKKV